MWEFLTGLGIGLAIPYVGPWLLAKWTSVVWPALKGKLPAWLGGA